MKFEVTRTGSYRYCNNIIPQCNIEALKIKKKEFSTQDLEGMHVVNTLEINTLDELFEFKNKVKHELILGDSNYNTCDFSIEIYDDYRE